MMVRLPDGTWRVAAVASTTSKYVPVWHHVAWMAEDPNVDNVRALSGALWDKGVGNALRIWDGWSHDWPYWAKMTRAYIGGHD